MPETLPLAPQDMAAKLAARLCHDLIGPAGGLASGLDLLEDPSARDMHADAMALVTSAGRQLVATLKFARMAYGPGTQAVAASEVRALVLGMFDGQRATLEWAEPGADLSGLAARALLNLSQIALEALARGGRALVQTRSVDGVLELAVMATGDRVRLHAEILSGLAGAPQTEGLAGRWVQARFLHAIITDAGGALGAEVLPGAIRLWARIPS